MTRLVGRQIGRRSGVRVWRLMERGHVVQRGVDVWAGHWRWRHARMNRRGVHRVLYR